MQITVEPLRPLREMKDAVVAEYLRVTLDTVGSVRRAAKVLHVDRRHVYVLCGKYHILTPAAKTREE